MSERAQTAQLRQRREGVGRMGGGGGGASLRKCLANLNSERTANTLSGTDSSHLVKKLRSQILLETEK